MSASASKPCCEDYGKWVGRLRLAYSQRAKLSRRMKGFASTSWPTAEAGNSKDSARITTSGKSSRTNPNLVDAIRLWTTPSHSDGRRGGTGITDGMTGSSLTQKVAQWPTPMAGTPAQNGNSAAGNSDFSRRADMLAEQVMQASAWPTPAARDYRTPNSQPLIERIGSPAGEQLPNAVAHGFTPPDLPKPTTPNR